jgi:hypothetical protein
MSLDYPFFEELRRRNHPAAKWWKWGDMLYYLGLVPAIILLLPILLTLNPLPPPLQDRLPHLAVWIRTLFGLFVAIFLLGAWLKGKSWRMAKQDGIDVNDY